MNTEDIIIKLTKQLFPTGRAFKLAKDSIFYKLMFALGKSEARAYDFGLSTLYRVLADNDNFTETDALLWEHRLNIPTTPGLTLDERKEKINRKYAFPGTALYRQNWRYLQDQLQKDGFDVYVHENRFPDGSGGWYYLDVISTGSTQHADETEHSIDTEMGGIDTDIIANSAEQNENYDLGSDVENSKGGFFIGGETFPESADINAALVEDFRKLVLQIKPVPTYALLNLNYVTAGNIVAISNDNLESVNEDNITTVEI